MPLYEYQCQQCHHEVEVLQSMSDAPLVDCPECSTANLKKVVSAAGFRLKGAGWYETDFKSGDKKNVASSSDASPTKASTSSKSTSATKTAASSSSSAAPTSSTK